MASDGSVDIKITGSVDPSVAASANQATASLDGLSGATTAATTDAKLFAQALAENNNNMQRAGAAFAAMKAAREAEAAATAGATAAEAANTAAKTGATAVETASAAATARATAAEGANTAATTANTAATINNRAAYEAMVIVHEALQGRFSRMAGSSLILGQALAGQSAVTTAVTFATSALGVAVLGTAAVLVLAAAATISYENEQKKLLTTMIGVGSQSGITAEQMKAIGESADSSSQSFRETTKAAEAFSAAGVENVSTLKELSTSVYATSELMGVKFAEAQKTLAAAMREPNKGAKELHESLGILDGDQLQQIETLTALGEKEKAVDIITGALKQRIDEAKEAGIGSRGVFGQLIDTLSNLYDTIGRVTDAFGYEAQTLMGVLIPALGATIKAHREAAAAAAQQIQNESELNKISVKGQQAYAQTPEGQAAAKRAELQGNLSAARDALKVDMALHGAHSEAVQRDKQAIEDYTHAVQTFLTPVQQKLKADQLDVQIAAAKHAHNRQLVADLTEQKALIQEAGKVESASDAKALAVGKGDVAGARTFAPKGGAKGPSIVSEWEEQLHQTEVLSNNFFADQTADELKFWQSKVGLVKQGSKEWLEVQTKIYDAQKQLAHKDYQEHIADLNDRLQGDRDDFKKFQADWQEKLAYIKSKYSEESTEYKDAHREMVQQERQFQDQIIREQLSGQNKAVQALKQHLQAQIQIRNEYAKATEEAIKAHGEDTPGGDITASIRVAELHKRLAEEEVQDAQRAYEAENALREQGLANALTAYGIDDQRYKNAVAEKKAADQQYYDQKAQLEAKSTQQQIQDILAVKSAYSSYISGVVGSTISGLGAMASGQQTWRQAVIGVYNSVASTFENALSKMVTNWIVEHVFMTSAQRAQLALQRAQHAAAEAAKTATTTTGTITRTAVNTAATIKTSALEATSTTVHAAHEVAKTGATTAGVAARTGVESTGFFAKLLSLLGINLGVHTAHEAAKTAATTTGATTRAAAEATAAATSAATQHGINVTLVTSYAGVAGAAGTASFAAAPWPIDMGAPAFGASMSAAALAYESLASLDVGTNYMPRDQVIRAHEGERIIPKADNSKLFEVLNMATGGGGNQIHLHSNPTFNGNQASLWQHMVDKHERDMVRWMNRQFLNRNFKVAA
jgi:Prophage tail length tape measure protein